MAHTGETKMHIGQMIEQELRRQGRSKAWLARELNTVRGNVYDILRRESIDTALLTRISLLLDHNFLADLAATLNAQDYTSFSYNRKT